MVGVFLGVLVAPVVVRATLGHLDVPTSLADVSTAYSTGAQYGAGSVPSTGTAPQWAPENVALFDATFDHPSAFDRLDELGALLRGPSYP